MRKSYVEQIPADASAYDGDESDPITVSIATDRQALLNELLPRLAKEAHIKVVGQCIDDPAFLPIYLAQWQPELLLLDKALLDRLVTGSLRMIQTARIRVLLLWKEVYPDLIKGILQQRFHGYLLIDDPLDVYVKAIRAVGRGEVWLPRGVLAEAASNLLEIFSHGNADSDPLRDDGLDMLTKRQEQIVRLLSQGFTNKQIAGQLGIMEDTVKKHLQKIFDKLGVRRRTLVALSQAGRQLGGN